MINGVANCCRRAHGANLANALDAHWRHPIMLLDKNDLDFMHICMSWHVILGDIAIHESSEPVIEQGLLMQRHADSEHDSTHYLAARRLGIEDLAGCDGTDDAGHANNAKLFIDLDFGKDGRMCIARIGASADHHL